MSQFVALIKRIFVQNWKMKLIALVFAFVLWSFVIAESNPPKTKTFKDIPVAYVAADELKQKDLTTMEPLSELLKSVTVVAEARANALQFLNENMIQVQVDLSSINGVGEYTLPIEGSTILSEGRIVSIEPSTVTIRVEEIITKEIPVEVQLIGEQKEGLYYGTPVIETPIIEITGARSNVEEVTKAICKIDISSMTETAKASYNVVYVTEDGTNKPNNLFVGSSSVIVEVPVYPQKEVPIDIEAIKNTTKGLADGYQIVSVTVNPQNVFVAGGAEIIDTISSVALEEIVLDNASGDTIVEAAVRLPEGVVAAVPAKVQVQLTIAQPEIGKVYSGKKIAVKNLEQNLEAKIDPVSIDIEVFGTEEAYDSFSSTNLKPFVDLAGLGKGVHQNIPIKFENEPDLGVRPVPSVVTVTVTIT